MSKYEQAHYKEVTPEETVEKLRNILATCGIDVDEHWMNESSINTYSLRITIRGTEIGSNGKGVSKAYARASAYAEFFERFQNGVLSLYLQRGYTPYVIANDEKLLDIEEMLKVSNPFFDFYFQIRNMANVSLKEKVAAYVKVNPSDFDRQYVSVPFFNLRTKKINYLPFFTYISMYGSNGMCAGNTPEEAIVQGLSEIFERVAQRRLFSEKPTLPVIPDSFIKKYPYVYDMYNKARENKNFFVSLRDCSFGGKYPVAALFVVEKNTGKYGLKLGCHPNMGIAMERTFTEICQGYDIFEYSTSRSFLDFLNVRVNDSSNVINSYKTGHAQYPYQLFCDSPSYKFQEMPDVSQLSNSELLKKWLSSIKEEYDVLIRDVSYTGFPSYHIIIPGLSEFSNLSDYDIRMQNTRKYVCKLLKEPESIKEDDLKYITATLRAYSQSMLENTLNTYYPSDVVLSLPFADISADLYLVAMCYISQKKWDKARETLALMCKRAAKLNVCSDEVKKLNAMYYYVSGREVFSTHEEVIKYLRSFFDECMCDYLNNMFFESENLIVKQYSNVIKEKLPYFKDFLEKLATEYGTKIIDQAKLANVLE